MAGKMTWHQSRAAESRRAILEAAEKIFLRDGYKTNVDAICLEAGISRRTLYIQFGSKEQLFRAVVEETSKRALEPLFKILDSKQKPELVLTRFAEYLYKLVFDTRSISFLRLCISEVSQFPDLATRHYETGMGIISPAVAEYLQARMDDGVIARQPASLLAEQFLSCFMGYRQYRALLGVFENDPAPPKAYVKNALKLVF